MLELLGLKPKLHSLSDWHYTPAVGWTISTITKVSPPSCVVLWHPNTDEERRIYLDEPLGDCIPEGRLTTYHWYWADLYNLIYLNFRSQEFTDDEVANNSYYCRLWQNTYQIAKKVAGDITVLVADDLPHARIYNTWQRWRITWWLLPTGAPPLPLQILLEQWHEGAWVEVVTIPDATPSWSDSAVNYTGIFIHSYGAYGNLSGLDDTIVERKT